MSSVLSGSFDINSTCLAVKVSPHLPFDDVYRTDMYCIFVSWIYEASAQVINEIIHFRPTLFVAQLLQRSVRTVVQWVSIRARWFFIF